LGEDACSFEDENDFESAHSTRDDIQVTFSLVEMEENVLS